MKNFKIYILFFCLFSIGNSYADEDDPNVLIEQMIQEMLVVQAKYNIEIDAIILQIKEADQVLFLSNSLEEKVNYLLIKDQLNKKLQYLKSENATDISKIRYIKGLQIIKLLYEKVLSLDHHFASVRTFSEINKISNPNQYPEFTKMKDLVKDKRDKKLGFNLTSVLGTNTFASVTQTFINLFSASSLSSEEKEQELAKIECILDFTLRMHNDLNTIYFETAYLQASNQNIKTDIETLFREFTKPISYYASLPECRNQDDWDTVNNNLEAYIEKMKKAEGTKQFKMQVELEFPIDRLILFINQYNNFISEGEKFYQKFSIILNSYENEKQCESKLPIEYKKLKDDVNVAIDKFNIAYKPVEINGSKMKEILYGLNEY